MNAAVELDYESVGDTGMNIVHFFIDPEYRRRGIGSTVLAVLLSQWTADGIEYVVVNMRGGEAARQFLIELGFSIVEGPHSDGFLTAEIELEPDLREFNEEKYST